jgi:YggT family protein
MYLFLDWLEKAFQLYLWILMARIVLSWFPVDWYQLPFRFIDQVTEPVFAPFRRLIPPIGGVIDISPMVLFFLLQLMVGLIQSAKLASLGGVGG